MEALRQPGSRSEDTSHDEPYRFGRRPTVTAPFPFTHLQLARLMVLRSRLQNEGCAESAALEHDGAQA